MNEKKRKAYIAEMLICGILTVAGGVNMIVYGSMWWKIGFGIELAAFIILSACFVLESRKK